MVESKHGEAIISFGRDLLPFYSSVNTACFQDGNSGYLSMQPTKRVGNKSIQSLYDGTMQPKSPFPKNLFTLEETT
jgi:hypothetical protein